MLAKTAVKLLLLLAVVMPANLQEKWSRIDARILRWRDG